MHNENGVCVNNPIKEKKTAEAGSSTQRENNTRGGRLYLAPKLVQFTYGHFISPVDVSCSHSHCFSALTPISIPYYFWNMLVFFYILFFKSVRNSAKANDFFFSFSKPRLHAILITMYFTVSQVCRGPLKRRVSIQESTYLLAY